MLPTKRMIPMIAVGLLGGLLLAAGAWLPPQSAPAPAPVAASTPSAAAELPDPFVLGFIPAQRAEEMSPDAERLAEFLEERLDVEVEVRIPSTYEPLVEGFRFGHVHAAFMDGGPAWIAHRRSGAEAIAAEVDDGRTHYWAEAFVLADSPIGSLEEVPGKRVAFTSRTGSSGFYMPIGSMIRQGLLEPGGDDLAALEEMLQESFATTVYAGGYRAALVALLEGRVDVAFGAHDAPERFLDEEQRARLRTLHRFGRIPSHAVMVSADLGEEDVAAVRSALLDLNGPEGAEILRDLYGVDGLREVETEAHLGEFGRAFRSLPGSERTLRGAGS